MAALGEQTAKKHCALEALQNIFRKKKPLCTPPPEKQLLQIKTVTFLV